MEHAQRERCTTLRRQPIDRLLYETIPFVLEELGLGRLTLGLGCRITDMPESVCLHDLPMVVFVHGQIARRRKQERFEGLD